MMRNIDWDKWEELKPELYIEIDEVEDERWCGILTITHKKPISDEQDLKIQDTGLTKSMQRGINREKYTNGFLESVYLY